MHEPSLVEDLRMRPAHEKTEVCFDFGFYGIKRVHLKGFGNRCSCNGKTGKC